MKSRASENEAKRKPATRRAIRDLEAKGRDVKGGTIDPGDFPRTEKPR